MLDNPMSLYVLVLVGIFVFAIAILFRSNEAISRVEDVERELGVVEDEVKEITTKKEEVATPESVSTPNVTDKEVEAPFPDPSNVHTA